MSHSPALASQPIAVVGVSALFPGSLDATGFWRDILAGRDLIGDVPPSHWLVEDYYDPDPRAPDKTYARRGGFLSTIDFDAMSWGIPPNIIPATDTSQLLALILAQRVLQDAAGDQFESMDRSKISVILGVTSAQELLSSMVGRLQRPIWVKALRESGLPEDEVQAACERISAHYVPWQESTFPGLLGNVVAGRIANRLDTGGTNCVTDAACASTFSALSMGISELQLGTSDLVISGGVDTLNDIFMYMCFSKTPALSATEDCRPYSDQADGTLLGEGLGMVALKRLADAERDGDRIYAVIKGVGTSSDGRSKSVYAPVSAGQANALRRAYARAGYGPETVELLEGHGTGTKAGDAAEFDALRAVFDESGRSDRGWCALGSVKSQIGHTKAAAGAAGLFKAIMALHHKVLPPTIKVERPNPKLDLEQSPFHIGTRSRPWIRSSDHPRRASVSSFGFGGSNYHLALEEYTGEHPAPRLNAAEPELLVLSAVDGARLAADARAVADRCVDAEGWIWAARRSHADFDPKASARLAIVASDAESARARLTLLADRIAAAPETPLSLPDGSVFAVGGEAGEVAFVFPGQGSQKVDMGAELAMTFEAARAPWDLSAELGLDAPAAAYPRTGFAENQAALDTARLTATETAQPAIGCASLSMLALFEKMGLSPDRVAGHSFGEISALHAAGVFGRSDMLRIARRRGELMAEAAAVPGAMIALRVPLERARELAERLGGGQVVVANHNGPDQVVLSGPVDAIDALAAGLKSEGVRSRRLKVSTAFHSPLMSDARAPFAAFLDTVDFAAPARPVYANTTALAHEQDVGAIRQRLADQLVQPVRFVEMVEAMYADGVRTFVEVGPGAVLTGLIGRILGDRPHRMVTVDRKGRGGIESLLSAVGELMVGGVAVQPQALYVDHRAPVDPATRTKPKLAVSISGTNYGKPYPPPGGAAELPKPNPPRSAPKPAVTPRPAPQPAAPVAAAPRATQLSSKAAPRPQEAGSWAGGSAPAPSIAAPGPSYGALGAAAATAAAPARVRRVTSGGPDPSPEWLRTFEACQRQTAEAHAAYQSAMADSHTAFMQVMQDGLSGLAGMLEQPAAAPTEPSLAAAAPTPAPVTRAAAPTPTPAPRAVAIPKPAAAPEPVAAAAPVAPTVDLTALMLAVVAEKTGYPADMLTLEMDLEGDLGIDSIKRVEILAAVREAAPALPELDPGVLGTLSTMGEIVEHLGGALGDASPAPSSAPQPGATAAPAVDLTGLMLAVVAEKTGYPADMLTLEMDLEGDLGIDSIKRVEILAAVREAAPSLPELDPGVLGTLSTMGEIVEHLGGALGDAPAPAQPAAEPAFDLMGLMLAVVAEKTGYPADMLSLDMDLEGDLGIDSIKRVEILAAVREAAPSLPELDPGVLGTLSTMGEIVEHLGGSGQADGPVAPDGPAADDGVDLTALMLAVVAEKTGYPADMLTMEMDLEGDLGIDSIKRVEILAAVREAAPALPELDPGVLGTLRTLGAIGEALLGGDAAEADADPVGDAPVGPAADGRYTLRPVAAPAAGFALPGLFDGEVLVTADGGAVADALVAELTEAGVRARAVGAVPDGAERVVFLGGLRPVDGVDAALAVGREAFAVARTIARGAPALFVTVQDTGGAFGLTAMPEHRAWLAGLPALSKTAGQEWPDAATLAIDIERGGRGAEAIARALADELLRGGAEAEVGLDAAGARITLVSEATRIEPADIATGGASSRLPLDSNAVVVVSGGARGVTAACVVAWAEATRARFVLLGRTPLDAEPASCAGITDDAGLKRALLDDARGRGEKPSPAALGGAARRILAGREIRATLAAVEVAGGQARYVSVDVTDGPAVAAALDTVRAEWGPITGVVHGAGVLADKRLADKTDADFERVYRTKVDGMRALLDATRGDDLAVLCAFSSVSGRCGNTGQSVYGMSNEILAKVCLAERQRRPGTLVKSLGWGPWQGGMVTPALAQHFARLGVPMIPLAVGAAMLVDELSGARPDEVELVLGGEPRAEALLVEGSASASTVRHIVITDATREMLEGHALGGAPVVPMVLVAEWFARLACAMRPGHAVRAVSDLQMLKGIRLDDTGPLRLVASARVVEGGALALALHDTQGVPRYRATLSTGPAGPVQHIAASSPDGAWSGPIYGGALFHEDRFQMIERVDGVEEGSIAVALRGVAEGWPGAWTLDIAALDGALQAALLLTQANRDIASLPTRIDALRLTGEPPVAGPLRCVVHRGAETATSQSSRAIIVDPAGRALAVMDGITTVARPDR